MESSLRSWRARTRKGLIGAGASVLAVTALMALAPVSAATSPTVTYRAP